MSPQESIAHYRIAAKIGEGGMGAVYRATDTKLARDSADNKSLLFRRLLNGTQSIWTLSDPLGEPSERKAAVYLEGAYKLGYAQFAPGPGAPRWVAYTSSESRRFEEVFVQSFPAGAGKFQISNGGGTQPRWRRDGRELFYFRPDGKLMAVDVKIGTGFEAGTPHVLFEIRSPDYQSGMLGTWQYDVSPDGKRFLFSEVAQDGPGAPDYMTVVTNWLAGVKRGGVAP